MSRHSVKLIWLLTSCFFHPFINSFGQINITGPACVIPLTDYQYLIGGTWRDSSNIQVCISGGTFLDSTTCYDGPPLSFIRLTWNRQDSPNSITFHSSSGDTSLIVSLTTELSGGLIDSVTKYRQVDTIHLPPAINCSMATGGNCNPVYNYQWQNSADNLGWIDIDNETSRNLEFKAPVNKTTYYRRKVIETISKSVDYSDVAIIIIGN